MIREYICSVLDREVHELKIVVEANLFQAIKLQPNLIIQAVLYVTSILQIELRLR